MDAHAETEAVEKRHGCKHGIARAKHRICSDDLLPECVEVEICQHDSLRRSGRTTGIKNDSGIGWLALDAIIIEAALTETYKLLPSDNRRVVRYLCYLSALGEHVAGAQRIRQLILYARDNNIDERRILSDTLKLSVKLIERYRGNAAGLTEIEFYLLLCRQRMYHICYTADKVDGIEHVYCLRTVRHGDGDSVALAHTYSTQRARAGMHHLNKVRIGLSSAHEVKGNGARIFACDSLDSLKHRTGKIVKMHRNSAEMSLPRSLDPNRCCGYFKLHQ